MSNQSFFNKIRPFYYADDLETIKYLLQHYKLSEDQEQEIILASSNLVSKIRSIPNKILGLDSLLAKYNLSTKEGVALVCLAESLLRIPDTKTINELIHDKLENVEWMGDSSKGSSEESSIADDVFRFGLYSAAKILKVSHKISLLKLGIPVIRKAINLAMNEMAEQFIMAPTTKEALDKEKELRKKDNRYLYSYDMLGEGARTYQDAEDYFLSYKKSIEEVGIYKRENKITPEEVPGVSIKLSALHPRYEYTKRDLLTKELLPKVIELAILCKSLDISMTIDAEEANRLEISLDIIYKLIELEELKGWNGLGLALQSYQKRAVYLIQALADLLKEKQRKISIRLVKGAYWDSEIKKTQELGERNYPVFRKKYHTDFSYLVCADVLLQSIDYIYPQFATHNAHTVSAILVMAKNHNISNNSFEFQRLYSMGKDLYDLIIEDNNKIKCRVYAPIGEHEILLPYLVRRILENGASSSFLHKVKDINIEVSSVIANPVIRCKQEVIENNITQVIPLPVELFGEDRKNSKGLDISDQKNQLYLSTIMKRKYKLSSGPIVKSLLKGDKFEVINPANKEEIIGISEKANKDQAKQALEYIKNQKLDWETPNNRANLIRKTGDLLEKNQEELIYLLVKEAGKVFDDAIGEVREAIDFCYYYANLADKDFVEDKILKGVTGEENRYFYRAKGIFICISPWNFPLAIFLGQIVGALAAGNLVIAKPSMQTTLVAAKAINLMYEAGIPKEALSYLPCSGSILSQEILTSKDIAGVIFTGSTSTASVINKTLAARENAAIPTIIAETGGLNAMIIDSSSLLEQDVDDIVKSAFHSAGQRCSALRLVFVQDEVADSLITMLKGVVDTLEIGDPKEFSTDIGPIIDQESLKNISNYCKAASEKFKVIHYNKEASKSGNFINPCIFELDSSEDLKEEVFGPVLHIVRYKTKELDKIIDYLNNVGFGLTFGIHSRINSRINYILERIKIGNIYVNRDIIGATVGVQPFGGEGLSGTGPKAGGENYLKRLSAERLICTNTTALGGNIELYSLIE
jgi:RHH-type transcriptional regulator, proline utilization regulon repressor / proline dehydrogenase / delta 1-pyrroline-5-carboxylate dehydrogenase